VGVQIAVNSSLRITLGWEVTKVEAGYKGLLEGRVSPMDRRRLGGIIGRGGTILGTQRSKEF
jgi:6-phosphofructokinase